NGTPGAFTVFIAIDSDSATGGTFSLETALTSVPAGDICLNAAAGAGMLMNQTTVGFSNNYVGGIGCSGTSGVDRVYSVMVPMGQRLNRAGRAVGGDAPSLHLVTVAKRA